MDKGQLPLPPDERRARARRGLPHGQQPESLDRLRFSLQPERLERLDLESVARELDRRCAYKYLARLGRMLES